jgi:energy-converting hydrogenase Eha subunit B
MAYRKRAVTRKPVRRPVRRRRRTMGAAMSAASIKSAVNTTLMGAAGGAAAAVLTNVIGDNLGGFKSYTGLVGALATSVFFKQPVIAAGMAGYAGSKVAAELTGSMSHLQGLRYPRHGW